MILRLVSTVQLKNMASSLIVAVHDPREGAHWRVAADVLAAVVRSGQPAAVRILPTQCARACTLEEWFTCLAEVLVAALPVPFYPQPGASEEATEAIYDADLVSLNAGEHPWTLVLDLSHQPGVLVTSTPLRSLMRAMLAANADDRGVDTLARREWVLQLFERHRIDVSLPESTLRDCQRTVTLLSERATTRLRERYLATASVISSTALRVLVDNALPNNPTADELERMANEVVRLALTQTR